MGIPSKCRMYVLPVDFRLLKDGSDDLVLCLQNMPVHFRGSLREVCYLYFYVSVDLEKLLLEIFFIAKK